MKIFKLTLSLLIFIWCAGFFYFVSYTKNLTNTNRNITQAIIIYGGNKERLYVGAQLLKLGYAPVVYITGDKPKNEYDNFIRVNNLTQAQFIFDPSLTTNNLDPINDSLDFMKKFQFHTARVVINTTQYPRAKIDFASKVPHEIKLIPHVVSRKGERNFQVFVEYLKYNITLLASFAGVENELNLSYS